MEFRRDASYHGLWLSQMDNVSPCFCCIVENFPTVLYIRTALANSDDNICRFLAFSCKLFKFPLMMLFQRLSTPRTVKL